MIEIKNLCKSFNYNKVLDNLNLTIDTGETKVIIGRSGCGKSVLLKHIVSILKPDSGQVIINDVDITTLDEKRMNNVRMNIGLVFQGGALFDSLTVEENVGFILHEYTDLDKAAIRNRVEESLSMVSLQDISDMMPSDLSGGMKKRVALARAICTRPKILLYDEPTTGVDPITADAINELIKELHDKLKITSIVVTHDMNSAYKVADRIAMLYHGKIIAEGSPGEISNTTHPIVKQFITGACAGPITEAENLVFGHLK
ncbi:MAG: ABC transporter ATP-binding protein [Candidatus Omnitrophica bacterium]|nr:ABC transporter ATP-binding protein [Candidatus Omnitrophota bacterium]